VFFISFEKGFKEKSQVAKRIRLCFLYWKKNDSKYD